MFRSMVAALAVVCSLSAEARAAFTGPDFSGVYDCTGSDDHEGDYRGTVTLELVASQSTGEYGAYNFKLEVPGYGVYLGHAAAQGLQRAAAAHQAPRPRGQGRGQGNPHKP